MPSMEAAKHACAECILGHRFASIAKLAGEQLQPYIAVLVPKLYRYQYDPNPRVRDAMAHIWRALVDNPKEALDAHFEAVVRELLKDIGGRLWRNREAACAALADLLQVQTCWQERVTYTRLDCQNPQSQHCSVALSGPQSWDVIVESMCRGFAVLIYFWSNGTTCWKCG